jgi:hypothetical protein
MALLWGEGFKDTTLGHRAIATLPYQGIQLPAERDKSGQFSFNVGEMLAGESVHGFTGLLLLVGQAEQRPNLFDGKAQIPRAPGKGKAADMRG